MTLCADAPHPVLPYAQEIIPPLKDQPLISQALGATWSKCQSCMTDHRRRASNHPDQVFWALTLFLMYAGIVLNAHNKTPGDNADAMVQTLAPTSHGLLSAPTRTLLLFLPVWTTTDNPDGTPLAAWDQRLLAAALAEIGADHRQDVWADAVGALAGIIQGEGRDRQEEGR